ncbi:MAG: prepilin-type N-terminal cleavage/methylation domain-containing protein [Micropepsaceae bacterium]
MKGERGFTLVEALVAFAILAVMLVALYGAVGTSLNGLARSARYEEAILIAEGRLAELAAVRKLPQAREWAIEGSGYRWRVDVVVPEKLEPAELSLSPFRAEKIKLTVAWQELGSSREIVVERQILLWRDPQ